MRSNEKDFLEILTNYQGVIHKVNLVYFRNQSDREENFQEVVYQLWKSFPRLKKRASIGSWIYRVAINTSITKLKNDSKLQLYSEVPDSPDENNILEEITKSESELQLLKAMHQLSTIDRTIMLLYLEEKCYEEIGEITGISISNVGVRINRAKEKMKQTIKTENHVERKY